MGCVVVVVVVVVLVVVVCVRACVCVCVCTCVNRNAYGTILYFFPSGPRKDTTDHSSSWLHVFDEICTWATYRDCTQVHSC